MYDISGLDDWSEEMKTSSDTLQRYCVAKGTVCDGIMNAIDLLDAEGFLASQRLKSDK